MKPLVAAVVAAVLGAFAPVAAVAAADQIVGDPLTITADGQGRLQIADADRGGAELFSEPVPDIANAGLEVVANGTYIPFNGNRAAISGPTMSTVGPAQVLTSRYWVGLDLRVTEALSYVDGEKTVDASYTIENVSETPVVLRAAEVADLGIGTDEFGRGFLLDHAGARTLGGWTDEGGLAALVEQTPWTSYETGFFKDVFDDLAAGPLSGQVDPRQVDHGVGAQWAAQTLAPGATPTFTVRWLAAADEQVDTTLDHDDGGCAPPDGCTLREALTSATTGGQIVTVPEDISYSLVQGTIVLDHDLTVLGGGARFTRIHGDTGGPVLSVPAGVTADLRSLTVTDGGGGIVTEAGSTLRLSGATVTGNHAMDGAGIHAAGALEVERSTISGNIADRDGGGVWLSGAPATFENSTLSGNTATRNGGAISAGSALGLTNVTLTDNGAAAGGGLWEQVAAENTDAVSTLFARNDGGHCGGTAGAIRSTSSLYDDHSCALGSSTGDRFPDDPRLGVLRDNGGDTDTHAPQGGSPALNRGTACPALDQRGEPRTGTCDIGAVEGTEPDGHLVVFTSVVNDHDGQAGEPNFRTHIQVGAIDVVSPHSGSDRGQSLSVPGGTYRLVITGPTGYTLRLSGACAGDGTFTMPPGGSLVCSVLAEDVGGPLGTLRVRTEVHNLLGGGFSSARDFTVHVRAGAAEVPGSPGPGTSQRDYRLGVGTYTVSVDAPKGYQVVSCAPVTVTVGATATCRIDAYDPVPTLLVVGTLVTNDDGGRRSARDFTVHVRSGAAEAPGSPAPGDPNSVYRLDPGTYSVSVDAPARYTVRLDRGCATGTVTLVASSTAICTILADDRIRRPRPHHSVNLAARSGTVKVKAKGRRSFVTLADDVQVPLGSIVDTRNGSVRLFAADARGRVTHADFSGGLFKVGQTKGSRPFTVLTLVGKLRCNRPRRLTGDGRGRFRTRGEFSSATARAAKWLTQDTCTTTTTKVTRGTVAVRDLARHRTVRVKAGRAYVARLSSR